MGYCEAVESLENETWLEQMGHGGSVLPPTSSPLCLFPSIHEMTTLLCYRLLLPAHSSIVMESADHGLSSKA